MLAQAAWLLRGRAQDACSCCSSKSWLGLVDFAAPQSRRFRRKVTSRAGSGHVFFLGVAALYPAGDRRARPALTAQACMVATCAGSGRVFLVGATVL